MKILPKIITLTLLLFINLAMADVPTASPPDANQSSSQSQQQYMPNQTNSANVVLSPNAQDQKSIKQLFDKANYDSLHKEKGKVPDELAKDN